MVLSVYQQALAGLTDHARKNVEGTFVVLPDRVRQNIADETALAIADFTSLLNQFVVRLAGGDSPPSAWVEACRTHKRKGCIIPDADCPEILGRAKGLDHHAAAVAGASRGDLTKEQARKLLLKYSGSVDPGGFETFLREASLGSYLVWA